MTYIHLPVDFEQPTDADFERFSAVMDDLRDERAHVHCIANLRVTAFLYRYRRDALGLPDPEARAAMDSVWQPGGVWAAIVGDAAAVRLPHQPARPRSVL